MSTTKITLYPPDGRLIVYRDPKFVFYPEDGMGAVRFKALDTWGKPVEITTSLPFVIETTEMEN